MKNKKEYIGYLAMILVAVSILMPEDQYVWFRLLNMLGAIVFIVYGYLIKANPVVILNSFLTIVNAYYIFVHFQ